VESILLRSGHVTLEYEIAQEKASTLGRLGGELEAALKALAACPSAVHSDKTIRNRLVEQAGHALWHFVVHREACGLNRIGYVIQAYGVPDEVYARMNPPTVASLQPAKR
jgi:hypothetical protein